ncbi:hypothetical protein [Rhodobium gokarnense]|uniref:XRE family transcriptional regulator n=1 Tax=Rhodobium gokarnense TaxID=364296 RepID=A0ABT3HEM5_9HYPH|nr:hypothetical protein [Rhodobium gokarnense]MCW2308856.1 hypothetical protein [Rhodobium gokarnense]
MPVNETALRQWADHHQCRSNLPILVRRLVRETTITLQSLRFPGNEAVDLAGLDGQAVAEQATVWVPQGRSIWEMGCNQNSLAKANSDYRKRTDETPEEERATTSFVFVTPRRWPAKNEWQRERQAENSWANVLAWDAIDLENWLDEAPATSRWIGELLGFDQPGLLTPNEWWVRWSTASNPPISRRLVATRRHDESATLLRDLRNGDAVVSVAADDRSEAVAFVIAALTEESADDLLDRTLVVTRADIAIPRSDARLIIIADLPEGQEPDFGDRRNLTIVRAYPRGRQDVREASQLSHVPSEVFRDELQAMGLSCDDAESLALKTGHSVPILRRHLSPDPEIRRPLWARDRALAKRLLPFALAGSWVDRESFDDLAVLQLLGELDDGEIERARDELLALDDVPIARYGNVDVVVSQLDALFAIGPYIDRDDLDRFFQLVPELLGDRDPALDLPKDKWWMANVLGKARSYSGALLSGLSDALCILSVYGAEICGSSLKVDLAYRASQVVRELIAGADDERWLSIRGHLRALAEAAPYAFLDCLEEELRGKDPAIQEIMGTTGGAMGGECLRTNLLWALEILAWHPEHFSRVAKIVFDLQRFPTDDNWTNSPASTAKALFLAWLPATSLNVTERLKVLRELSGSYRTPTIDVCISLLPGGGPGLAFRTSRPRWRALEKEVPEATNSGIWDAAVGASHLLLDLVPYSKLELDKVLEVASRLHPDDLGRLVTEVERWGDSASDGDKAELRHDLRRREVIRASQNEPDNRDLAEAFQRIENALEPTQATMRHRWLFENTHVEWRGLIDDEDDGRVSWREREARVKEKRSEALAEIEAELGPEAILPFALDVKRPELVAQALVSQDSPPETATQWARKALRANQSEAADSFLRQVFWTAGLSDLKATIASLEKEGLLEDPTQRERLAKLLPGRSDGWEVAAALGPDVEQAYWNSVSIRLWDDTPADEVELAVTKLLAAQRPRSAFNAVIFLRNEITPDRWERILKAISRGEEPNGPSPGAYELEEVFECLDNAPDFSDDRIASLELPFVPLLCNYGHRTGERTLALHKELARDPALFIQLLTWHYGRRDGAAEPELEEMETEHRRFLAETACHLLEGWKAIPGMSKDGKINAGQFLGWTEEALRLASDADRREVAELHVGALIAHFARHRSWEDWLPEVMLDVLDRPEHGGLRERFTLGVHNARGVTTRGPYDGGAQERVLAEKYRGLAARYGNSHPRVSAVLTSIAEGYDRDAQDQDERAALGERWHP